MPLRWIVFDAVGTVIYPTPSVAETYHQIGLRFGTRLPVDDVRIRFRSALQTAVAETSTGTSEADEEAFWRAIVAAVFDDITDSEACFRELFEHFSRASAWACFDDVESTLSNLKARGFRLAVASNFDRRLHPLCDGHAALRHFERRVISSEVGHRKPARQFFEAVLQSVNCPAGEVLVVGDDFRNDIDGARSAGLHAMHLRRDVDQPQGERPLCDRDFIQSLRELGALGS